MKRREVVGQQPPDSDNQQTRREGTMKRNLMLGIVLTLGLVIGATGARLLGAQPVPFKATDLLKADVIGMEGIEVVVTVVDFAPRATTGKHTHPGHEIAYVLEGSGVSDVEGQAPEVRKAGTITYIPSMKVHESRNESAKEPMKLLVFRIHPKGQPIIDSRLSEASFMK
jgi:quercetin dioxygenase-like cupin family protein